MFDAPCAAGVTIDHQFVKGFAASLENFAAHCPLYLATGNDDHQRCGAPFIEGAIYLRCGEEPGRSLCVSTGMIRRRSTSGFTALNLAVQKRAKKIVLLGYDYGLLNGRHHYHDCYPWHHAANDQSWATWARAYDQAAAECVALGIEVVNASPCSTVTAFKRVPLEEVA